MKKLYILLLLIGLPAVVPAQSKDTLPATEVFKYVDQMPEPPYDLVGYLSSNIVYPLNARKKNKQGQVSVKFVVDENGQIQSPEVIQSVYPSLDREALRVVSSLPRWNPGKQNGTPVKVFFTLPILFRLTD